MKPGAVFLYAEHNQYSKYSIHEVSEKSEDKRRTSASDRLHGVVCDKGGNNVEKNY